MGPPCNRGEVQNRCKMLEVCARTPIPWAGARHTCPADTGLEDGKATVTQGWGGDAGSAGHRLPSGREDSINKLTGICVKTQLSKDTTVMHRVCKGKDLAILTMQRT